MTVNLVVSLPRIPYIKQYILYMVLANPNYESLLPYRTFLLICLNCKKPLRFDRFDSENSVHRSLPADKYANKSCELKCNGPA